MGDGISYEQAKQMTDEFSQDCLHLLNEGKSVKLERIGKIRKDVDGRFLFDPDTTVNYLEESFGLPSFMSPPISRTPIYKRMEKRFMDRHPRPERKIKNKKLHWAAVALVPVLLLIGFLVLNPVSDFVGSQKSGLITISEPEINNPGTHNSAENSTPESEVSFNEPAVTNPKEVPGQPTEKEAPLILSKEKTIAAFKYYVIGGAFKVRENADNMLTSLRSEGYPAEDAGQNPAGLYMVSYFSSEDRSEALVNLNTIRREKNPSAWMLKK
jgi:hypothetical protein